jgi:citrate lyase beta subunit
MILSLITDDVALAAEAERAGIDRIMIDLEREGKAERQAGRKLFQSSHCLESIAPIKAALERAPVIVRINPLSSRTQHEIEAVIAAGADVVMLPYFFTAAEVRSFTHLVGGRGQVSLLVETVSAIGALSDCLAAGGIDEVHIGLNDLSIELGCDVILEPLCTAMIEELAATLREAGVPFGIGGIGRLSCDTLPVHPQRLLAEQVRLGCSRGWLGRTFREGLDGSRLGAEVTRIRDVTAQWREASEEARRENRAAMVEEILAWKARVGQGRGCASVASVGAWNWTG